MVTEIGEFRRRIGPERVMLMLPLNVVLAGHVNGAVDPGEVETAFRKLRIRHPLLGVRVKLDDDAAGWYVSDHVPDTPVHAEPRSDDRQWTARMRTELQTSFPIETGPLVRCAVIHSAERSDIILCGHHAVCDGMSLGYLLRDLLHHLAGSSQQDKIPLMPPPIDPSTVPNPPGATPVARFIMNMLNRKWAAKNIRFSQSDMLRMHQAYWQRNSALQILDGELSRDRTSQLVERCRTEHVTVNSALWTAFLTAQYEVQGGKIPYHRRCAMAVNTRDKLTVPVGEAFGFYASSLPVTLPFFPDRSFWDKARTVHAAISNEIANTNLFRMLSAEMMHPTLLDSIYFQKYGFISERLSQRLLRKLHWDALSYGCAFTNAGRFDIPMSYGPYQLEAVHGPLFYSDAEEKIIGAMTVGGRLSFLFVSNESVMKDAVGFRDTALEQLNNAFDS